MEDEDRGIRGSRVDFVQGRQPFFTELKFRPATNDAHPLRGRGAAGLLFKHLQGDGQGRHSVPAQLHIVVQAAANDVDVGIVQSRNDGATLQIDHSGGGSRVGAHRVFVADREESAIPESNGVCLGRRWIKGGDTTVDQDRIGIQCIHGCTSLAAGKSQRAKTLVASGMTR